MFRQLEKMNLSKKKFHLVIILLLLGASGVGLVSNSWSQNKTNDNKNQLIEGCPANPDSLYDRRKILKRFSKTYEDVMKEAYGENFVVDGFEGGLFVFDLNDPSNNNVVDTAKGELTNNKCINFIDGHVYHFSRSFFPYSLSQITFLENGEVKIFKSINCKDSKDKLEDVLTYLDKKLASNKNKDEILIRIKNYRRYGFYINFEFPRLEACQEIPYTSGNLDDRYNRPKILRGLNDILDEESPKLFSYRPPLFSVHREQAIGFFVYDLTDPSNKQTSLLERVDFINNHIYHFAFIDAPYSFSNIVILEDGKLKVFKSINCKDKGDSIEDVLNYLMPKLKDNKNKDEIINRVKNYRQYGVYASFENKTEIQCQEAKE